MDTEESAEELVRTLDRLRDEKEENLTAYQKRLLDWSRNVDRGYAWFVLVAQWFIVFVIHGTFRIYGLIFVKIVEEGYYTREEAAWPVSMIMTLQTLSGLLVSVASYYMSFRQSILFGGVLVVLGNGLTTFSSSLFADTLLLGVVQGVGYGFAFTPLMEVSNSYFLKYRAISYGVAMSGGTVSVFALEPLFTWLLDRYPWRWSYMGVAGVSCLVVISALVLRPHPRPSRDHRSDSDPLEAHTTTEVDLCCQYSAVASGEIDCQINTNSCRIAQSTSPDDRNNLRRSQFDLALVWSLLRTPAFHFIWYLELVFYWVFSISSLVVVDYGKDRGFSQSQAESLIQFQSVGELFGRIAFAILLDAGFVSTRMMTVANFTLMSSLLALITQAKSFPLLAAIHVGISAACAFIDVLVSKLLVRHLGERQVTLAFGLASFICGLLIIFRPQMVGLFRDRMGSYDPLMVSLSVACLVAAALWLLEPWITRLVTKK